MNAFVRRFGMEGPLVVAPMGGGPTTPELVAATSNAGALGSLAGAYLQPEALESAIRKTRTLTSRPFVVNLFVAVKTPTFTAAEFEAAKNATRFARDRISLPDPELRPPYHPDFDRQFEIVLRERPAAFSFVFGLLDGAHLRECRSAGIYTIGTATTFEEALALNESGVDAIVAQGSEAGGHSGVFDSEVRNPGVRLENLVRAVSAEIDLPVIAAGGLMSGKEISKILKLGAEAAMLGTAFLLCPEAATSPGYRRALLDPARRPPRFTRAFSGRFARGLANRFLLELETKAEAILPFPTQNAFTRDIRSKASELGDAELLSLWAGTGIDRIEEIGAAALVARLLAEIAAEA